MYKKIEHIPTNTQKLVAALHRRDTNMSSAATEAGYTATWLVKAGTRGFLTPPQMAFLLSRYGITREEVAPDAEDAQEEIPEDNALYVHNMTQGDLYETIFDAVRDALKA